MKKKRRAQKPPQSALESARAALERAGEEESPVSLDDAGTPDTDEPMDGMKPPEAVTNAESEAPVVPEAVESQAPVIPEAVEPQAPVVPEAVESQAPVVPEAVESQAPVIPEAVEPQAPVIPEAVEPQAPVIPEAVESQAPVIPEDVEPQAPVVPEDVEPQAPVIPEAVEPQAPVIPEAMESQTPANMEQQPTSAAFFQPDAGAAYTPEPDADAVPFEQDGASAEDADEADAPEDFEDEDPGNDWNAGDEPFPDAEEVTDTERHTMETREITLGYHTSPTADEPEAKETEPVKKSAKKSGKHGKKPRFQFLKRLREAVRKYTERMESDDAPPSVSARDEALRKRVMQIEDEETRNYLLDRVLPQMAWYSRKSAQYQKMYYRLMAATIILGALIPILSPWANHTPAKIVLVILGASVTAINAYLALHNYHDLSITYRMTREDLTHTLYCYFNGASVFSQKKMPPESMEVLLVDICEETLSKENGGWRSIVTGSPV